MPRISFIGSSILLVWLVGCFWTLVATGADKKKDKNQTLDDKAVLALVETRATDLIRITEKPVPMRPDVRALCVSPKVGQTAIKNPHWKYNLHIYVPKESERIIRSGKESYPVGTLIVKEKLSAQRNKSLNKANDNPRNQSKASATKESDAIPALFTAMLKREKGYNSACGDWEFITISGDAKEVTSRGKIDSCMNCHKDYKASDFITRTYMKDGQPAKAKAPREKNSSKNSLFQ